MNILKITGKFLDQPILISKFEKNIPYILGSIGAVCTAYDVKKAPQDKKNETLLRTGITVFFTILSALAAPKIANKIFNKPSKSLNEIKKTNTEFIDKFLKENNIENSTKKILNKAKTDILSPKEIKKLNSIKDNSVIDRLIPQTDNITSKDIFSEISRLSILGLIPVMGGITGGIAGDIATNENLKNKIPNKIKEGTYQYLANIFLCNIGAGMALGIMEKVGIKGKSARALGMISGILATGVVGGSIIANFIGNKLINPLFGSKETKNLYSERKPEALDIGLHIDDIATVGVMSGLKWIEPALPIMYSISGYRAGIGYRNVNECNKNIPRWN